MSKYHDDSSRASHPGGFSLHQEEFRRLEGLTGIVGLFWRWKGREVSNCHRLPLDARLLTVNTYYADDEMALDLVVGPGYLDRYTNFYPVIAEFYSDDLADIEARKKRIAEDEWQRCRDLGQAYLREFPDRHRDGSLLTSATPVDA